MQSHPCWWEIPVHFTENCIPQESTACQIASRTKKPTTMLSVCFLVITVTLGFGVLVPFVFYFFVCFGFFACLFFTFFSFNGSKWGIVTFGDNQAKLYSGSQTLSRISPGPGSLLELGVAEKHTYDTSGGSFKWTKHPRKITFRNPKQLLSNYTNNTSVLQISRAASINNQ